MKKLTIIVVVVLVAGLISSCAAKREPCPAYSQLTTQTEKNS